MKIDTTRKYLSSSPANGVIALEPFTERWITDDGETSNSEKYGDNHFYNYRPDCEDVTTMVSPRFSSEYGFQSMPSFETMRAVSESSVIFLLLFFFLLYSTLEPWRLNQGFFLFDIIKDWTWDSPLFKFRNHRTGDGQQEIADQMMHHFQFPTNSADRVCLSSFPYCFQLL